MKEDDLPNKYCHICDDPVPEIYGYLWNERYNQAVFILCECCYDQNIKSLNLISCPKDPGRCVICASYPSYHRTTFLLVKVKVDVETVIDYNYICANCTNDKVVRTITL